MYRYTRTDLVDGTEETLTLVTSDHEGYVFCLHAETTLAVRVTQGTHFAALFDLDGTRIDSPTTWEIAEEVSPEVLAAFEKAWEHGNYVVRRHGTQYPH